MYATLLDPLPLSLNGQRGFDKLGHGSRLLTAGDLTIDKGER